MSYIETTDILDITVRQFVTKSSDRVTEWMSRTDEALESLAKRRGVQPASISATLDFVVKMWCVNMFSFLCCSDNLQATPDVSPADDQYWAKAKWFRGECARLEDSITREMLEGVVALTPGQMSQGVEIFRG